MRDGRLVRYIVMDRTDAGNAAQLGVNYSAKLQHTGVGWVTFACRLIARTRRSASSSREQAR